MGNERLSGLALMHTHRDIPISINMVLDEFAHRHPRWSSATLWLTLSAFNYIVVDSFSYTDEMDSFSYGAK